MAYVTAREYYEITGEAAPDNFDRLCSEADAMIDQQTLYGLQGRDVASFPSLIQYCVKRAAAHQVQYLDQCGGLSAINDTGASSMTLGKFSYSGDGPGSAAVASPLLEADLAIVGAYLRGLSP